jgi:hypothetical protein
VRVCVCVCGAARARGRVRACSLAYPAFNAYEATVTLFVAPRSLPYFSTLSHKRCDFRKNVIEHKMCALIFSTNFV